MTHIPYGYRIENSIVITHKEEAAKIVALYKAYLKHKTLEGSARAVGINKVHGSIGRILKNRCYLGNKIFPQIIDEDLFSAVQKILQSKTFRRKREIVPREKVQPITSYIGTKVDVKFDNPYLQAEYAYTLIKEAQM